MIGGINTLPDMAPSVSAVRACLDWWRSIDDEHKSVFAKAKLTPASWWKMQPVYRLAVLACDECQEMIQDEVIKSDEVGAAYVWKFESVTAYGHMEVWRWAKSKNHGKLLSIEPYSIDSPFHYNRMLVQHNASSKFYKSFRGRAWMRDMLGKKWAGLVNKARRCTKQDWMAMLRGGVITMKIRAFHSDANVTKPNCLTWDEKKGIYTIFSEADPKLSGAEKAITSTLSMSIEDFWRYSKGIKHVPSELMIDKRPKQLELFEMGV